MIFDYLVKGFEGAWSKPVFLGIILKQACLIGLIILAVEVLSTASLGLLALPLIAVSGFFISIIWSGFIWVNCRAVITGNPVFQGELRDLDTLPGEIFTLFRKGIEFAMVKTLYGFSLGLLLVVLQFIINGLFFFIFASRSFFQGVAYIESAFRFFESFDPTLLKTALYSLIGIGMANTGLAILAQVVIFATWLFFVFAELGTYIRCARSLSLYDLFNVPANISYTAKNLGVVSKAFVNMILCTVLTGIPAALNVIPVLGQAVTGMGFYCMATIIASAHLDSEQNSLNSVEPLRPLEAAAS